MSESDFLVSAILGAFTGDSAESVYKCGVFGAVHYVGDTVRGDVYEFGCFVGVKVGVEVGSLADRCSCRFDGVVEEVGSLIVREVVGFFGLAREGEAEPLLAVLSVVLVGSFKVGVEGEGFHFGASFRVPFYTYIIAYSRAFVKGFSKNNFFIFFKKGIDKPGLLWYNICVRKRGQHNENNQPCNT